MVRNTAITRPRRLAREKENGRQRKPNPLCELGGALGSIEVNLYLTGRGVLTTFSTMGKVFYS